MRFRPSGVVRRCRGSDQAASLPSTPPRRYLSSVVLSRSTLSSSSAPSVLHHALSRHAALRHPASSRSSLPPCPLSASRSSPSACASRPFASSASVVPLTRVRNLAIIAHVDHGKTTLVDCLLRQSAAKMVIAGEARVMDSNALEKERGITILSKCTSILWQDERGSGNGIGTGTGDMYHLNIVDTPGHADFGGEVERIMSMVDGVCLVVDATDGPMTQTKFVLTKALKAGLRPVVVINKVDRPTARLGEVENEVFDLFANLNASDDQMEFPIIYACARDGWATRDPKQPTPDMAPLFQTITQHIQPPAVNVHQPFSMLVTQIDSDPFLGKLLLGRISSGTVKTGDRVRALDPAGKVIEEVKVLKLLCRRGLDQVIIDEARAGDIISLAGFSRATVRSTLCSESVSEPIFSTPIDPPTLSMSFYVNDSPLAGKEGTYLTSAMIKDRLWKEAESNVSIEVTESENKDSFEVRGRGELQLGILIETMRREGYELSVSAPRVVFKEEAGELLEPVEDVVIDVDQEYTGGIIEKMSLRKAELLQFDQMEDGKARLAFRIAMRGLIGYRTELNNDTRGMAVMNASFHSYTPYVGDIDKSIKGAIISSNDGDVTSHALETLESRGVLFVTPGDKTYNGMVIGEHSRDGDLECNPTKRKELSNMRTVQKEDKTKLTPPRLMSLEEMIAYVRDDEVIEVTSSSIRLRKKILDAGERKRVEKAKAARKRANA